MAAKAISLEGYGKIMINPINFENKEYETVDMTGQPVSKKTIGERAKSIYVSADGTEIPNNKVCKKINIEGEDIILPKFGITKDVSNADIEVVDDDSLKYNAIERKLFYVATDNAKIKDLVLVQKKSLKFPLVVGSGWKAWSGLLTYWGDQIVVVGCRGDLTKELSKFSEDTVDIEYDIAPQDMRKVVRAMAMV